MEKKRTTKRHIDIRDTPGGKGQCRWCCGPLPKGRRSWCSQRCVDEYLVRSSSSVARQKVFERDRGVCAVCGVDTEAKAAEWLGLLASIAIVRRVGDEVSVSIPRPGSDPELCGFLVPRQTVSGRVRWDPTSYCRHSGCVGGNLSGATLRQAVSKMVLRHAVRPHPDCPCEFHVASAAWKFRVGRHLWEADHIVPVVEGGGGCGLENLRTLCLRCHHEATAKLAARRAAWRRLEREAARRQS